MIKDICACCGEELYIVNITKQLCDTCNYKRLHGGKTRGDVKKLKYASKPKRRIKTSGEMNVFKEVWQEREHKCTYCGKHLSNDLKPIYFSHIKSKGAFPELRHNKSNIELVCAECHQIYEFGDRSELINR